MQYYIMLSFHFSSLGRRKTIIITQIRKICIVMFFLYRTWMMFILFMHFESNIKSIYRHFIGNKFYRLLSGWFFKLVKRRQVIALYLVFDFEFFWILDILESTSTKSIFFPLFKKLLSFFLFCISITNRHFFPRIARGMIIQNKQKANEKTLNNKAPNASHRF